jgi:aspartate racemase
MKTIGLLGGMSWESSLEYYRIINEGVKTKLGGHHSAKCLMYSLDFHEIEHYQHLDNWDAATALMIDGAQRVERGGAECLVICTNTMHKMAEDVQAAIDIPIIHIADATAQRVRDAGIQHIGLLGTAFTMEHDFYKGRLIDHFGLNVHIPNDDDRVIVHRVIYDELVLGTINPSSRAQYRKIMAKLVEGGAQGVILGCTEIELLVQPEDTQVPQFPTTQIHAEAAVAWALDS